MGWKQLELGYAPSGRPLLELVRDGAGAHAAPGTNGAAGGDSARRISLLTTISHDAGVLVAAVVAQEDR